MYYFFRNFVNYRARYAFSKYVKISLITLLLIDLNHNSNRSINYITERQGFLPDLIR